MTLGKAIKLCRENKHLTLAKLAAKAGLSTSYISLLEQGKRDPNLSKVEAISAALGVPLTVLLFLSTDKRELETLSPELAEKFSLIALKLIESS